MAARKIRNAYGNPESSVRPKTTYVKDGSTWEEQDTGRGMRKPRHPDGLSGRTANERRVISRHRIGKSLTPEERAILAEIESRV